MITMMFGFGPESPANVVGGVVRPSKTKPATKQKTLRVERNNRGMIEALDLVGMGNEKPILL